MCPSREKKTPIAAIAGFIAPGNLGWSEGSPGFINDWEMSNSRGSEVKNLFGVLWGLAGTTGCAVFNTAVGMNVSHVDEEAIYVDGPGGGWNGPSILLNVGCGGWGWW